MAAPFACRLNPNKFVKADDKGSEFQFTITDLGDHKVRVTSVGRNNLTSLGGRGAGGPPRL